MSFQYPTVVYPFDTLSAEVLEQHKSRSGRVNQPTSKSRVFTGSEGKITIDVHDNNYYLTTGHKVTVPVIVRFRGQHSMIFETPEHDFYQVYQNSTYIKSDLLVY